MVLVLCLFLSERKHHLLREVAWSRQAKPSLELDLVPALVSWICISVILCFVLFFFPATFCVTVISSYPDIWGNLEKFHAMFLKMKNIATLNFIEKQQPEYARL